MNKIYLDNSATTKQYDCVTDSMLRYMREEYGNPSSLHRLGMTAEKAVKEARKAVAAAMGVAEDTVYFTSGGTESDNTAIFGAVSARKRRGRKVITSAVEHPAVLEACRRLESQGYQVAHIGVDSQCRLDLEQLKEELTQDTILISIMQVNNETGTRMPIEEIATLKNAYNKAEGAEILLHTDSVQALGKMALPSGQADMISVSGHKIHGPKGIGAISVRKGLTIEPFMVGGGQEGHFRSGTENVPAIAGFGQAARLAQEGLSKRQTHLSRIKKYLQDGIQAQLTDIKVNGWEQGCCPAVLNLSFLGTRGEVLLHSLEQEGIYVSTGSACSSNKKGRSHVLAAMGLSEKEIEGAIRFSFSEFNTVEEMDFVLDRLAAAVNKFRKLGSFR